MTARPPAWALCYEWEGGGRRRRPITLPDDDLVGGGRGSGSGDTPVTPPPTPPPPDPPPPPVDSNPPRRPDTREVPFREPSKPSRKTTPRPPPAARTPRLVPSAPWTEITGGGGAQRNVSVNPTEGPIPPHYGLVQHGGGVVMVKEKDGDLYAAVVLGPGPIEEIVSVTWENGLTASELGITVQSYLGTAGQTLNTMLNGVEPLWVSALPGFAYLALKFPAPTEESISYNPFSLTCVLKGLLCFDTRTSTTAWTDNPALAEYDLWTNKRYGGGFPTANFEAATINAAANTCDVVVGTPPAAPGSAPTATGVPSGGGELDDSNPGYTWVFTAVDTNGLESPPSGASNAVITYKAFGFRADVVLPAGPGGTVKRKVYRSRRNGTLPRRFVGEVNNNTAGHTFADLLPDASLGGTPPTSADYRRYRINLSMLTIESLGGWLDTFQAHMNAFRVFNSGTYQLYVDAQRSGGVLAAATTFSDQTDPPTLIGLPTVRYKGAAERPNKVIVRYVDERNDFKEGVAEDEDAEMVAAAQERIEEQVVLNGCPSYEMALRIAKMRRRAGVYRNRSYTLRTFHRGVKPLPNGIIKVTSRKGPMTAKEMIVLNVEPDGLAWNIQAENYDANVYSDTVTPTEPPVNPPPPGVGTPPAVTGLTAPITPESAIGTVYWSAPTTYGNTGSYEVFDMYEPGGGVPTNPLLIRVLPLSNTPTSATPLQLQPYIHVLSDGTRKFVIGVRIVATDGVTRGPITTVSWTIAGTIGTPPHDDTFYAEYAASIFDSETTWAAVHASLEGTVASPNMFVNDTNNFGTSFGISRGFTQFNTAPIPDDAGITAAKVEFYATTTSFDPARNVTLRVVASTAGDGPFEGTDFDQVGGVNFGSVVVTTQANQYVSIPLNASGLAAINKTGLTKFAIVTDNDFTNTEPGVTLTGHQVYMSPGPTNGIRLVVTYTSGTTDVENPPPSSGNVVNRFASVQTQQTGNAGITGQFRAGTFEGELPLDWGIEVTGTKNGINGSFTIPTGAPLGGGFLTRNGGVYVEGYHYTRSGANITIYSQFVPQAFDVMVWFGNRPVA